MKVKEANHCQICGHQLEDFEKEEIICLACEASEQALFDDEDWELPSVNCSIEGEDCEACQ